MGADLNWRVLANARWLKRASPEAGWAEARSCSFHVCCGRRGSPLQQTSQRLKINYSTRKTCTKRGWYTCRQCLMHVRFYNVYQVAKGPSRQLLLMEEIFLLSLESKKATRSQSFIFGLSTIEEVCSGFFFLVFMWSHRMHTPGSDPLTLIYLCCNILLPLLSPLHPLFRDWTINAATCL